VKKCPKCENEMENKGEFTYDSRLPTTVFYQCPKCKNIEMERVDVPYRPLPGGRTLPKEHWPGREK